MNTSMTTTENGALSNATVGDKSLANILEYFSKAGTFTGRSQSSVNEDMERMFQDNELYALRMLFALRLVSRELNEFKGEVQTGFGRRDEFFKGMTWLLEKKPDVFYKNMHLIPQVGCWKDLLTLPLISLIDREKFYKLIQESIDKNDQLLLKFLPQIRSKGNIRSERDRVRSEWAKGFCKFAKISPKNYRKLKAGGSAHIWQRQMGTQQWDKINFNGIPGKAMFLHTSQKGKDGVTVFERHNQTDRLLEWVLSQSSIKFTGYVYELVKAVRTATFLQRPILDRQFETVLEPMRGHHLGNVLSICDTSSSMSGEIIPGVSARDICFSLGIAFSSLNTGYFRDTICMFDDTSTLMKLNGTFCQRIDQINNSLTAWGGTNFESVIDMLVKHRRDNPEVPVSEYPETLLVISDMQFNPVGNNAETNYQSAMKKLTKVGLGNVRFIWWHVNAARTKDFPSTMEDKNVFMISGFDPVNLKTLMGMSNSSNGPAVADKSIVTEPKEEKEKTPLDGMLSVLNQKFFEQVSL